MYPSDFPSIYLPIYPSLHAFVYLFVIANLADCLSIRPIHPPRKVYMDENCLSICLIHLSRKSTYGWELSIYSSNLSIRKSMSIRTVYLFALSIYQGKNMSMRTVYLSVPPIYLEKYKWMRTVYLSVPSIHHIKVYTSENCLSILPIYASHKSIYEWELSIYPSHLCINKRIYEWERSPALPPPLQKTQPHPAAATGCEDLRGEAIGQDFRPDHFAKGKFWASLRAVAWGRLAKIKAREREKGEKKGVKDFLGCSYAVEFEFLFQWVSWNNVFILLICTCISLFIIFLSDKLSCSCCLVCLFIDF